MPLAVKLVPALLSEIVNAVAVVAAAPIDKLPVPVMFRLDKALAVRVVMVCKPPPTEALETTFTVPGLTPFSSCSVNAVVMKPNVVFAGTAGVPFRFTVVVLAEPAIPS